jgi:hypothetical protein
MSASPVPPLITNFRPCAGRNHHRVVSDTPVAAPRLVLATPFVERVVGRLPTLTALADGCGGARVVGDGEGDVCTCPRPRRYGSGLVAVDVVPSPKFQLRDATVPSLSLERRLKVAVSELVLLVNVKLAVGGDVAPPPLSPPGTTPPKWRRKPAARSARTARR